MIFLNKQIQLVLERLLFIIKVNTLYMYNDMLTKVFLHSS